MNLMVIFMVMGDADRYAIRICDGEQGRPVRSGYLSPWRARNMKGRKHIISLLFFFLVSPFFPFIPLFCAIQGPFFFVNLFLFVSFSPYFYLLFFLFFLFLFFSFFFFIFFFLSFFHFFLLYFFLSIFLSFFLCFLFLFLFLFLGDFTKEFPYKLI